MTSPQNWISTSCSNLVITTMKCYSAVTLRFNLLVKRSLCEVTMEEWMAGTARLNLWPWTVIQQSLQDSKGKAKLCQKCHLIKWLNRCNKEKKHYNPTCKIANITIAAILLMQVKNSLSKMKTIFKKIGLITLEKLRITRKVVRGISIKFL